MLAAFVWWVRWMREEQAKGGEHAVGWGMGAAMLFFTAAMAAGAGALDRRSHATGLRLSYRACHAAADAGDLVRGNCGTVLLGFAQPA